MMSPKGLVLMTFHIQITKEQKITNLQPIPIYHMLLINMFISSTLGYKDCQVKKDTDTKSDSQTRERGLGNLSLESAYQQSLQMRTQKTRASQMF